MKKTFTSLLLILISTHLFAQTGPYGVGQNNVLWLEANDLVTVPDGFTWNDKSGNGFNAVEAVGGNVLSLSGTVPQQYLEFGTTGSYLTIPDNDDLDGFTELTVLLVSTYTNTQSGIISKRIGFNNNSSWLLLSTNGGPDVRGYAGDDFFTGTNNLPTGTPVITTMTVDNVLASNSMKIFVNSDLELSNGSNLTIPAGTAPVTIGGRNSGAGDFEGSIAEIIVYEDALNDAERLILENSLNEKYAIGITNDFYGNYANYDNAYNDNITGIGTSDGIVKVSTSASVSGLQLSEVSESLDAINEFIFLGHDDTETHADNNTSDVADADITDRWAKQYYLEFSQGGVVDAAEADARFVFDFGDAGLTRTGSEDDYVLLYRSNSTGEFSRVKASDYSFQNGDQVSITVPAGLLSSGYYTLGRGTQLNTYTWYSYLSGDWSNPASWTLDGAVSALYINPDNDIPAVGDSVVITSGRTIVTDLNDINIRTVEIIGTLDIGGATGLDFGFIEGAGTLRMSGNGGVDNYPLGIDSLFYDNSRGGTVEMYGTGVQLSDIRRFNNLVINLTNTTDEIVQLSDSIYVFGDFTVSQGGYQINDNSATDDLVLSVHGDLLVEASGVMTTGQGNARHELDLYGDFENTGSVSFTQRTAAVNNSEANDGIIDLNLISDISDQSLQFRSGSTANLYRIEINKGVDATYKASLSADDPSNFGLYGFANENHAGADAQITENDSRLGLIYGTVEIGNNISIGRITNNVFKISEGAKLVINGGSIISRGWIANYGEFEISSGVFDTRNGAVSREAGSFLIDGGTVNFGHFRTSQNGAGSNGSWTQNGGVVNIQGDFNGDAYYGFSWTYETCSFTMTGGDLIISSGNNVDNNGIFLNIAEENQNVTGGTVTLDMAHTDLDSLVITSNVPFYNLALQQTGTNGNVDAKIIVDGGNSGGASPDGVTLEKLPLRVLNDFTIQDNVEFDNNDADVEIGGTLTIGSGTTVDFKGAEITFNQAGNSLVDLSSGATLAVDTLILNKVNETDFLQMNTGEATIIQVDELLNVASGNLRLGTFDIRVENALNISDTVGVDGNTGELYFNGAASQSITSSGGLVYNMNIDNTNGVSLSGDLVVGELTLDNGVFDIATSALTMMNPVATNNTFGVTNMIQTSGNASDGGVQQYFDNTADPANVLLPIGTNANASIRYTPASIDLVGVSDDGYIRVNPVDAELATTDLAGGNILSYYWRVRNSDFTTLPNVSSLVFTADATDNPGGTFVPGGVEDGVDSDDSPATDTGFDRFYESDGVAGNVITFDGEFSTGTVQPFQLRTANYTAGVSTRFDGTPDIFYTFIGGDGALIDWEDGNNWTFGTDAAYDPHDTRQLAAGDFPQAGDIAIIGWVPHGDTGGTDGEPHGIAANGTVSAAEVRFSQMLDTSGDPTERIYTTNYQFRPTVVLNAGGQINDAVVSGEGMFWNRLTDPDFSNVDLGGFVNQDSAYFLYENESSARVYVNVPAVVPNLLLGTNNWGLANNDFQLSTDLTVNQDLEILGNTNLVLSSGATGDITVANDLRIFRNNANGNNSGGRGEVLFPNDANRSVEVFGDLILDNNFATIQVNNPENTVQNVGQLTVHGNISQDIGAGNPGGLQLYTAVDEDYITLTVAGEGNHSFDILSGQDAAFYDLIVNKGTDQTSSFSLNSPFTLNSTSALDLQNGTLIINNSSVNLEIANGTDFTIPASAGLEVTQGTVTTTNAGIILAGLLRVNGGNVDLGNGDIEYTSTGNSTIEVSSGTLEVGGQVRRSLTSSDGVLNYTQTGGDVDIAVDGTTNDSRAAFEIMNTGSDFTMTGGTFNILQGVSGDGNPSIELSPDTYDLTGSTITIFENLGADYGASYFNIKSSIPLNNLTIANTIDLPDVRVYTEDLEVNALTINNNQVLLANGFNVTINGDFTNDGTYTNSSAETIFGTAGTQTIGGTGTFSIYDLRKNGAGIADLTLDLDLGRDFYLDAGTLDVGSNSISLQNNAYIRSVLASSGGNGLVFNGVITQSLHGVTNSTVSIGTITINNGAGVDVPDANGYDFDITENLRLDGGVFDIGESLVTMKRGSTITAVSPFNVNNMVQTNSSFTDSGLKAEFYTVAADTSLFFPVGALKYTPVDFMLNAGTTQGSIRIKPANEIHPTIVDDTEPGTETEIDDLQNVLQYYWIVEAEDLTNATGEALFVYDHADIMVTAPYDTSNYISARLLSNGINWDKFAPTDFLGASTSFRVSLSNFTSTEISGDYTAGVGSSDGVNNDIEGAIPDQLAQYVSAYGGAGNYNIDGNWTPIGSSPTLTSGIGPVGAQVTVSTGDDVTLNLSNIRLYSLHIEPGAIVRVPSGTINNRLGTVTGTGTIVVVDNELLPTGEYSEFFGCSGGAIQYSGTTTYNILSGISQIRKVILEGSGVRTMPGNNVAICDTLELDGPTVSFELGVVYNIGDADDDRMEIRSGSFSLSNSTSINLTGDFVMSGGTVVGESGSSFAITSDVSVTGGAVDFNGSDVTLNGTIAQNISGNFTGGQSFDDLTINNSSATGVTITSGDVEVDGTLTLTDGLLNASASESLTINSSGDWAGASTASYVNGPLTKDNIGTAANYSFPVGDASRLGTVTVEGVATGGQDWTASYATTNGDFEEPINTTLNVAQGEMVEISSINLWTVSPSGTNSAIVEVGIVTDMAVSDMSNVVIAEYNGPSAGEWVNLGGTPTGTSDNGTLTAELSSDYSGAIFSIGGLTNVALPVELIYFNAEAIDEGAKLYWATASEVNNSHFEIERSVDGVNFEIIGEVEGNGTIYEQSNYAFIDYEVYFGTVYYRLVQIDLDGRFEIFSPVSVRRTSNESLEVALYPNPTDASNINLSISNMVSELPVSVTMIGMDGKVAFDKSFTSEGNWSGTITPDAGVASGLYQVIVQQGSTRVYRKVVIR